MLSTFTRSARRTLAIAVSAAMLLTMLATSVAAADEYDTEELGDFEFTLATPLVDVSLSTTSSDYLGIRWY